MKLLLLFLLMALGSPAFSGEPPADAKAEIGRLLAALGSSKCEFYRNGSWHNAVDAQAHLTKKYEYLLDKGKITTTEQFIADGGSKSSMSGERYQVRCPDRPAEPSATWLTNELARLRKK